MVFSFCFTCLESCTLKDFYLSFSLHDLQVLADWLTVLTLLFMDFACAVNETKHYFGAQNSFIKFWSDIVYVHISTGGEFPS